MSQRFLPLLFLFIVFHNQIALAQDPERFEDKIREYEAEDRKHLPKPGQLLFTGSSSILMWQDIREYFPKAEILNRGFGGSQFSDLLHYVDRLVYPYKPSKIFVYEGDNDLADGETPEEVLQEAIQLREEIAKELPNTPVVFISAKPSLSRWHLKAEYEEFNQALEDYTAQTPNTEYVDVWEPMLTSEGKPEPSYFLKDGLHMKPSGYQVWKEALLPFVE